jgi:enoyl-CoA hydratase
VAKIRVLIKRVPDGKITLQETSKIAIVTINRPTARNAMTSRMWRELAHIAEELNANRKIKVVILRGVPGEFTAGSDIKEFCEMSVTQANETFGSMEKAISGIENLSIPVIGLIDGPAMGAGFVLSLACDVRLGTKHARMGIPVGRLGITLGPSFVSRIVRLIGPSRTKELVFTNRIYDAPTSFQLGLLNQLVDAQELDHHALKLAQTIMNQSRASLKAVKESVNRCYWSSDIPWDFVDPVDFPEGCLAFAEKRNPRFR